MRIQPRSLGNPRAHRRGDAAALEAAESAPLCRRKPKARKFMAAGVCSRRFGRHRIQRVYGEKPGHAAHAGMEGAEVPRLSRWREAHHQELRHHLATQVSAQISNPSTVKELMRHTSLTTTPRYVRSVTRPYETSVAKPRSKSWRQLWRQIPRAKISKKRMLTVSKPANVRNVRRKHGGRSRNRTYDLAHVRRAL